MSPTPGLVLTYVWLATLLAGPPGTASGTTGVPAGPPAAATLAAPGSVGAHPAPAMVHGGTVAAPMAAPTMPPTSAMASAPASAPASAKASTSARAPASAASQDPAEILRATAAAYESMHSVAADFTQVLRNTLLGRTTESMGTLYQKGPVKFLMDFSDPNGDKIVSDGRYFWMYFPSVDPKQVIRTPRRGQGLDLKGQFIGDPVARFEYTYEGTEVFRGEDVDVFTLVPREPAGYQEMKVWIDADDHLVRQFELRERNGIVRHMELRNVVVNPELPDRLFEFTPPEGAIVVERG